MNGWIFLRSVVLVFSIYVGGRTCIIIIITIVAGYIRFHYNSVNFTIGCKGWPTACSQFWQLYSKKKKFRENWSSRFGREIADAWIVIFMLDISGVCMYSYSNLKGCTVREARTFSVGRYYFIWSWVGGFAY